VLAALASLVAGCAGRPDGRDIPADIAAYTYSNEPLRDGDTGFRAGRDGATIASSDIPWRVPAACRRAYRAWLSLQPEPRGLQDIWLARGECPVPAKKGFVGVAITGGGNKSAVYAAEVLFELARYGLADDIDVVSSVSGGSFTASLYALSCDPGTACDDPPGAWTRPVWDYRAISRRLETNYLAPFLVRRALPSQLYLNVFTHHGSSDDMADIVGADLFEERGRRLLFSDLNPARPNLILNASNVTRDRPAFDQDAGIPSDDKRPMSDDEALHFAFTQQYFWRLMSRLDSFPLSEAVVASAAFPLLIDRPSLRVYRPEDLRAFATGTGFRKPPTYVSLFDGGVHDNFGLTELRWFVECQFDRDARRTPWTPEIRRRYCGQATLPVRPPAATLILGINSSLLRVAGVSPKAPKPRSWDSYLGPIRISGTADSIDMVMAAAGELRKMELRSLIEEISRASVKRKVAPGANPFLAPGNHQYVDIDLESAYYLSCPSPVRADAFFVGYRGADIVLNAANGATERSRCDALLGVLQWNVRRNLALPKVADGYCSRADCPELDDVVGDRTLGEPGPPDPAHLFIPPAPGDTARLIDNQLLFDSVRDVPTNFELSARYVRLLRYVARWAVAHRVWELCDAHRALLAQLPGGAEPVCDRPLAPRPVDDDPK